MYDDILGKQESKKTRETLVERLIDEPLNKKSKRTLKKTKLNKKAPTPALIEDDDDKALIDDKSDDKCDGGGCGCIGGNGCSIKNWIENYVVVCDKDKSLRAPLIDSLSKILDAG